MIGRRVSITSIHFVALLLRLGFFFVGDDVEPTQLIVPLRVFVLILQHENGQRLGHIDDHSHAGGTLHVTNAVRWRQERPDVRTCIFAL